MLFLVSVRSSSSTTKDKLLAFVNNIAKEILISSSISLSLSRARSLHFYDVDRKSQVDFIFFVFASRCLLNSENEFRTCLEHFFPEILRRNSLNLTRQQWNLIRRRFGKPRRLFFLRKCNQMNLFVLIRFSSTYLTNERKKLSKQRTLLRIIQNQSQTHYSSEKIFLNNLPSWIPSTIPLGSRVIGSFFSLDKNSTEKSPNNLVRLARSAELGFSRGTVISRDRMYQVSFDDPNIGVLNIDDIDIMVREIFFPKTTEQLIYSHFSAKSSSLNVVC